MAQKAIFRSELCALSQPPGASRGMMIGVLEVSGPGWEAGLGKRLQSQDPPGSDGPSPVGGDLVPESQSGKAQVGTAQELWSRASGPAAGRDGEEVTDGRGRPSQPPPARGSQDDLVYQCPRKGGGPGSGEGWRAWGVGGWNPLSELIWPPPWRPSSKWRPSSLHAQKPTWRRPTLLPPHCHGNC